MKNKGVETLNHYPIPLHLQEAYHSLGYKKGNFPVAEECATKEVSLPIWVGMWNGICKELVRCIESFNFE